MGKIKFLKVFAYADVRLNFSRRNFVFTKFYLERFVNGTCKVYFKNNLGYYELIKTVIIADSDDFSKALDNIEDSLIKLSPTLVSLQFYSSLRVYDSSSNHFE